MDEILARFMEHLVGRVHGPMNFRMVVQPLMAALFALRDGLKDAKAGKPAFGWAVFTSSDHRRDLVRSGWKSVGKVFVLALVLDGVYQGLYLRWFYPLESLATAVTLAIVPYLLLRGPINRLVGRRAAR